MRHIPVLVEEVAHYLSAAAASATSAATATRHARARPRPRAHGSSFRTTTTANAFEPRILVDGTFGAGGYTRRLLDFHPDTRVIAIDRDPLAIQLASDMQREYGNNRLTVCEGTFGRMDRILPASCLGQADGVVLDVGVSSMQLDDAERGFSYKRDGPLDMRMRGNAVSGKGSDAVSDDALSAYDVVNTFPADRLARIIAEFGEERHAKRIAHQIALDRHRSPIATTKQLTDTIYAALPGTNRSKRVVDKHPAMRTFQALRIFVNDELNELNRGLEASLNVLRPSQTTGSNSLQPPPPRLVIVTFHSLEDNVVMNFVRRHRDRLYPMHPRTIRPSDAEVAGNPRARSAKLRAYEVVTGGDGKIREMTVRANACK